MRLPPAEPSHAAGAPASGGELVRQVERARTLNHPNIQQTYGMGKVNGTAYIASEYVEGESLRSILLREGQIGIRKSMKIGSLVARALEFAVRENVIHGDVIWVGEPPLPSNLLV